MQHSCSPNEVSNVDLLAETLEHLKVDYDYVKDWLPQALRLLSSTLRQAGATPVEARTLLEQFLNECNEEPLKQL